MSVVTVDGSGSPDLFFFCGLLDTVGKTVEMYFLSSRSELRTLSEHFRYVLLHSFNACLCEDMCSSFCKFVTIGLFFKKIFICFRLNL